MNPKDGGLRPLPWMLQSLPGLGPLDTSPAAQGRAGPGPCACREPRGGRSAGAAGPGRPGAIPAVLDRGGDPPAAERRAPRSRWARKSAVGVG